MEQANFEHATCEQYPTSALRRNAPHPAFGWLALLTPAQGRLLLVLWGYADLSERAPRVFPNNATLAHWCGTQRAAIRRCLAGLVEAGAVRVLHDPDTCRRWIELAPSPSDPRRAAGKRKPKAPAEAPAEQLELPTAAPQNDHGGGSTQTGGGIEKGPPPRPSRSPEPPENHQENHQRERGARARVSLPSAKAPRADWRAVLEAIHAAAPSGAYRSVDPQRRTAPPPGLCDLIDEVGADRLTALYRAYASVCSRDAEQLPWWGPNMFREPQAGVVLRLATPELRAMERREKAARERERERARLEAEAPIRPVTTEAELEALAQEFFAGFEQ